MEHIPITIIGADIVARILAYRLQRNHLPFKCVDLHNIQNSYPGFAAGGALDHVTRTVHQYDLSTAVELWEFAHSGFDQLVQILEELSIPYTKAKRARLTQDKMELNEFNQAEHILNSHQQICTSERRAKLTLQYDGTESLCCDEHLLLESLLSTSEITKISSIDLQTGTPIKIISEATSWSTDVCIITNPWFLKNHSYYQNIVYPRWEQWHVFQLDHGLPKGTVISSHHGQCWGVIQNEDQIHFGGFHYINRSKPFSTDFKLKKALNQHLDALFGKAAKCMNTHFFTSCVIQDERPLLGMWPLQGYIYLACGWNRWHLSAGTAAALQLYEWVSASQSPNKFSFKADRPFVS